MPTAEFEEFTSRTVCIPKMSCHQSSNCTCQSRRNEQTKEARKCFVKKKEKRTPKKKNSKIKRKKFDFISIF